MLKIQKYLLNLWCYSSSRHFFMFKAFKISIIFTFFYLTSNVLVAQNLRVNSLYTNGGSANLNNLKTEEKATSNEIPSLREIQIPISVDQISKAFKNKYHSQQDIAKNIFLWIAWNIDYDQEALQNKQITGFSPELVLSNQKSLCLGFAELFNTLCLSSGLESRIIQGFAKGSKEDANFVFNAPNHAWNSVKIDGAWYLVDVSWASTIRSQIEKEHNLKPSVANQFLLKYYKTVPEQFILTHLPEDPNWQLASSTISLQEFQNAKGEISKKFIPYSGKSRIDHAKSIAKYESLDSLDRVIAYMERSVDITSNLEREYGLGIAYYYKAQELSNDLLTASNSETRWMKRKIDEYFQKSLQELSKVSPKDPEYEFASLMYDNIRFKLESIQNAPVF